MFGVLGWILFGLIVGVIAKLLMPGRDPGGFIVTIVLGIGGWPAGRLDWPCGRALQRRRRCRDIHGDSGRRDSPRDLPHDRAPALASCVEQDSAAYDRTAHEPVRSCAP